MADTDLILCEQRPIPEKEGTDLLVWLSKPEAKTLVRIVESKARDALAKATNAMLLAAGDSPLKVNIADKELQTARRYRDFLTILVEIREQKEPYAVSKWTP